MELVKIFIKVKKLVEDAKLPEFAHEGDAGADVFSIADYTVAPGEHILVKTGIAIGLPPYTEAQIRPRSGLALKNGITVLNAPGTVDSCYRGEVGVIIINHGTETFEITKGMKIAQMVIKPTLPVLLHEVEELDETDRSVKGFGSSGV